MKIEVREAPGKGRGVFAKSRIKAGEIIEVCPVIILSEEEYDTISEISLGHYVFCFPGEKQKTKDVNKWKRACVALGWGSLYNHSFTPNSEWELDPQKRTLTYIALRDIRKGEEILHHYYWPDWMYKKDGIPIT